ncbi:MAG: DUF190 domain-containing protein [bacterium]|nr:DUF190 domain-containing protein [bacterium]
MTRFFGSGHLVRIFIGEDDRFERRPLYKAIVLVAREMGLGGATVLRGVAGFGAGSVLHTSRILRLSHDLPVVIEVVETEDKLEPFVAKVEEMLDAAECGALITREKAEIIRYHPPGRKEK